MVLLLFRATLLRNISVRTVQDLSNYSWIDHWSSLCLPGFFCDGIRGFWQIIDQRRKDRAQHESQSHRLYFHLTLCGYWRGATFPYRNPKLSRSDHHLYPICSYPRLLKSIQLACFVVWIDRSSIDSCNKLWIWWMGIVVRNCYSCSLWLCPVLDYFQFRT